MSKFKDQELARVFASAIADQKGEALKRVVENFWRYLHGHGLLSRAEQIITAFDQQYDREQGIERAVVTTARELLKVEQQELIDLLTEHRGRPVKAEFIINPDLIGGFMATIGDEQIDGSLLGAIGQLKQKLTHGV